MLYCSPRPSSKSGIRLHAFGQDLRFRSAKAMDHHLAKTSPEMLVLAGSVAEQNVECAQIGV